MGQLIVLNCLKPLSAPSNTVLEEPLTHLSPDLRLFNSCDIIAGPLQSVTYIDGRKWRYMNYHLFYNYYKLVEKLDCKVIIKYHIINMWSMEVFCKTNILGLILQNLNLDSRKLIPKYQFCRNHIDRFFEFLICLLLSLTLFIF